MSTFRELWNVVRRSRIDDELRQELSEHIALLEEEAQKNGLDARQARREARIRFGSVLAYRERSVEAVVALWLDTFCRDVRFAARQLWRRPGYAFIVMLLLGLGIGLNAGMFAVINGVILRTLPLPAAEDLVIVNQRMKQLEHPISWPDFLDIRRRSSVLASSAGFTQVTNFVVRGRGDAMNVEGSLVTSDYFRTLGVAPATGRIFEDREREQAVALLREDFWRSAFGADPGVVGQTITVNGQTTDVVGIMPRSFRFPNDESVIWMPLAPSGQQADRGWHAYSMVGRLKTSVTIAQARGELENVMQQLATEYPDKNAGRTISVRRLQDWILSGDVRRQQLLALQIAAIVLLFMTCANVSGLLLARSSARRLEFSIRTAMGASRLRQFRQHVTEGVLLTGLGCIWAAGFAWATVRFLRWTYGSNLPRAGEITLDWRLLGVVVVSATSAALVLGCVGALHQERKSLEASLRESSRTSAGLGTVLTRRILVVAQVGCAALLISVTGQALHSLWSWLQVDIGVDRTELLTMQITLPSEQYRTGERVGLFFDHLAEEAGLAPGVIGAAAINMLPVRAWGFNGNVNVEGMPPHAAEFFAEYRWITPDYFRTMGIPLLRGRLFLPEEITGMRKAAIINETMARRLWGTKDPLGAHVNMLTPEWITVVGVVRDVRQTGASLPPSAEIFMPASTFPVPFSKWALVVRSPAKSGALLPSLRRVLQTQDRDAVIDEVKTMDDVVTDSMMGQRVLATLLGAFALLALSVSALGIYGLVAYLVMARTRELAIRAALGSTHAQLLRLVGREGLVLVSIGLALGLAGMAPASLVLAKSVFGISGVDLPALAGMATILVVTGGAATLIPAARTLRIDPLRALRQE
jgi:putative ABC transport system permease protein